MERVRETDPIHDPQWLEFLDRHPRASVFHTPGWLEALRRSYGYEPVVLTTSSQTGEIANGVVFCRMSSWLTGRRIVSLPFSDHCEPLVDDQEELHSILDTLSAERSGNRWKYVEIRPTVTDLGSFRKLSQSKCFWLHRLDLRPGLEQIFGSFHKDCIQRKIRRAEREGLLYEGGRSKALLEKFYRLLVMTRRRHLLLPQPIAWFRNLIECMGDKLKIHVASKDGEPVAGILTLSYKTTVVYKYGCSDRKYSNLGGTQFLFWKAIQDAKYSGHDDFDLGRSDPDNPGLVRFKGRLGAARSTLIYWRYGVSPQARPNIHWNSWITQQIIGHAPRGFLSATGAVLYRHVG